MSNQNRCIVCPKCSINKVFILLIQTVIYFRKITERFSTIIHFLLCQINPLQVGNLNMIFS